MGNFDQGTNWKAKNAASIRLRAGDGKKHPVITTATTPLTGEARERAEKIRAAEQDRLARQRQAREAAARGAARDSKAENRHADRGHTPRRVGAGEPPRIPRPAVARVRPPPEGTAPEEEVPPRPPRTPVMPRTQGS